MPNEGQTILDLWSRVILRFYLVWFRISPERKVFGSGPGMARHYCFLSICFYHGAKAASRQPLHCLITWATFAVCG